MPQNFDNFMWMEKQELMRKITTHVCAQTCGTNDAGVHRDVLEGGEGGVGGSEGGGGGGGSGWDTPPPRVSGKKMGKIFFFLPKMAMAPKKTKICGTSSPAKICLQWGLNQLPVDLQCTVLPLTYHTELVDLCIPRFIA